MLMEAGQAVPAPRPCGSSSELPTLVSVETGRFTPEMTNRLCSDSKSLTLSSQPESEGSSSEL